MDSVPHPAGGAGVQVGEHCSHHRQDRQQRKRAVGEQRAADHGRHAEHGGGQPLGPAVDAALALPALEHRSEPAVPVQPAMHGRHRAGERPGGDHQEHRTGHHRQHEPDQAEQQHHAAECGVAVADDRAHVRISIGTADPSPLA